MPPASPRQRDDRDLHDGIRRWSVSRPVVTTSSVLIAAVAALLLVGLPDLTYRPAFSARERGLVAGRRCSSRSEEFVPAEGTRQGPMTTSAAEVCHCRIGRAVWYLAGDRQEDAANGDTHEH